MNFIIFYLVFTYLFEIGLFTTGESAWLNLLLAPLLFPITIGRGLGLLIRRS